MKLSMIIPVMGGGTLPNKTIPSPVIQISELKIKI